MPEERRMRSFHPAVPPEFRATYFRNLQDVNGIRAHPSLDGVELLVGQVPGGQNCSIGSLR